MLRIGKFELLWWWPFSIWRGELGIWNAMLLWSRPNFVRDLQAIYVWRVWCGPVELRLLRTEGEEDSRCHPRYG